MHRKKQRVARNKQKKQLRRKQRERQSRQTAPGQLSRMLTERLHDAYDLIHCGDYDEAEELLQKLDRRASSCAKVVEALVFLYRTTDDRERCCEAAERLMVLCPHDADARIMYAQQSMFCGRASIASCRVGIHPSSRDPTKSGATALRRQTCSGPSIWMSVSPSTAPVAPA